MYEELFPLDIMVSFDKKTYKIQPYVSPLLENGSRAGFGKLDDVTAKIKYNSDEELLGNAVLEAFEYILRKYEQNENVDLSAKKPSWKNNEFIGISREKDGSYYFSLHYKDLVQGGFKCIERRRFPSDITSVQLGREIIDAFKLIFIYAERLEISLYYSEKEGIKIIPMTVCKQGNYVSADYCESLTKPFEAYELRRALERAFGFARACPEDNRSKKERRENPPWRQYSRYKSWYGFSQDNHYIEIFLLPDGSYVFLPSLRSGYYDNCLGYYVVYEWYKTVLNKTADDNRIRDAVLETFKLSEKITDTMEKVDFMQGLKIIETWLEERKKSKE